MKKIIIVILFLVLVEILSAQGLHVIHLQCDGNENPIATATNIPHFSWQLSSEENYVLQQSYRILVSDNIDALKQDIGNMWDSKTINSAASLNIAYEGKALQSSKEYYWKIRILDNKNKSSQWSDINTFRIGLLSPKDWNNARWIAYQTMHDSSRILPSDKHEKGKSYGTENDTLPLFRKVFFINRKVKQAILYISGLGHFDAYMNGRKIGDHFLDPGWTDYEKEKLYVALDVTKQLQDGENALGIMLGNGFYYIPQVKKRYKKLTVQYGYPKMICRLAIEYVNGSNENIISNNSWKAAASPIIFSSIYGGEDYDATKEQEGWNRVSFNDKNWRNAIEVNTSGNVSLQQEKSLKVIESFTPKNIFALRDSWVYDLGQNFSGICQISVQGNKGDTITIVPSELLKNDSSANQNATGKPYLLKYILKGKGIESWQPQFTYYGFRYLEIYGIVPEGKPNSKHVPVLKRVVGLHTRYNADVAGSFSCSSELFNKIFNLINWSIKSNMASVLTDCPHREKLGWLEQLHLMGNSIKYNWQIESLFKKSINDMKVAQTQSGLIPEIAPEFTVFTYGGDIFRDSPEWGSSCIIVPWYVYRWYGDSSVLNTNYDMMKRYVNYLSGKAQNNIVYQGLGDWYDLGPNPPGVSQLTPQGLTATAIYYYDLTLLQKIATLLYKNDDAAAYKKLAYAVKDSFNKKYFKKDSMYYGTCSQTANAMALYMQLVPDDYIQNVFDNLVKDIEKHSYALTAGDIGYRYVLKVLQDNNRSDIIYKMNNRSDVPGYGYQLAKGATSLTESWQALSSVSNNHLMLGHFMEWLYEGLAGIRQANDDVAFKHIIIKPELVGNLSWAKASYQSPYGLIVSSWKKKDSETLMDIDIPPNTSADVCVPVKGKFELKESGKNIYYDLKENRAVVHIGSGSYHFAVHYL
ncbi:MAG: family 78 glycoside hydrolase catalytic domain [Arachidicoccus sp.]|nr:family 78 glycoside hydrolase catalytic domain [Arachidicoccus sp.]